MDMEELSHYQNKLVEIDQASQTEIHQQKLIQEFLHMIGNPEEVGKNFLTPGQRSQDFVDMYNKMRKNRIDERHIKAVEELINAALLFLMQNRIEVEDLQPFSQVFYSFIDDSLHFVYDKDVQRLVSVEIHSKTDPDLALNVKTRLQEFQISFLSQDTFRIVSVPQPFEFVKHAIKFNDQIFDNYDKLHHYLFKWFNKLDKADSFDEYLLALSAINRFFVNGINGFALSIGLTDEVGNTLSNIFKRMSKVNSFEELNNEKAVSYLNSVWNYVKMLKSSNEYHDRIINNILPVDELKKVNSSAKEKIDYNQYDQILNPLLWQRPEDTQFYTQSEIDLSDSVKSFTTFINKLFKWSISFNNWQHADRVVLDQWSYDGKAGGQ